MEKRLYRNETDKMLAGVASGLAEYFEMDVTWVRIIFVFAAIFGFSGVIIYIILWIVIPPKSFNPAGFSPAADYRVYEDKTHTSPPAGFNQPATPQPPYMKKKSGKGNGRLIGGLLLVVLGIYFLLDEFNFFPAWFELYRMWPVLFIILGVHIITKPGKKTAHTFPQETSEDQDKAEEEPAAGTGSDQPLR